MVAWEAGTAVGTLLLAFATASLAWYSRRDVVAQWRPVLTVDERQGRLRFDSPGTSEAQRSFTMIVWNSGRGPALNIESRIFTSPTDIEVIECPPRQSLPPGRRARNFEWKFLRPSMDQLPVSLIAELLYEDVGGRKFTTRLTLEVGPDFKPGEREVTVFGDLRARYLRSG